MLDGGAFSVVMLSDAAAPVASQLARMNVEMISRMGRPLSGEKHNSIANPDATPLPRGA
jgi:hypothetical protein